MVIGVIGRGPWGENIRRTLVQDPRVELILQRGRNWQDLLEQRLSGVVIASPASTHVEIAVAFLQHNPMPLYIEKPVGLSVAQVELLCSAVLTRPSLPILAGHTMLFSELYERLKIKVSRALQSGLVPVRVDLHWTGAKTHADTNHRWDYGAHALAMLLDALSGTERDGQFGMTTGTYTPIVRIFEVDLVRRSITGPSPYCRVQLDDVAKTLSIQEGGIGWDKSAPYIRETKPPLAWALRVFIDAIESKPDSRLGLDLTLEVTRRMEQMWGPGEVPPEN